MEQGKSTIPPPPDLKATSDDALIEELQRSLEQRRKDAGIELREPAQIPERAPPRIATPEEIERRNRAAEDQRRWERQCERRGRWSSLVESRGSRYGDCTLETFDAQTSEQKAALNAVRTYIEDIGQNIRSGLGIVFYGPRGTGKDHLAMAVCREAIRNDLRVKWQNGMDLFGDIRDAMTEDGESEKKFVDRMVRPDLLYLSDPLPPIGSLTQFQAAMLFRILDARYSRMKPLVCTVNVANRTEFDERIGPQNSDRIRDGAIAVFCNWQSYRKVRS